MVPGAALAKLDRRMHVDAIRERIGREERKLEAMRKVGPLDPTPPALTTSLPREHMAQEGQMLNC